MKKILKTLLFLIFGILLIGTFVFLWNKSRTKEVKYETVMPEIKTIEKKTIITGTVEPRNEVAIKPQISGIVVELYKEAGELVRAGDVIAKVQVIPDIAQLNSAESRLNTARINLEHAQNNFDRTEKLHQSGVSSKEAFEQAETQLRTAKEEYSNAQESLQIIKEGISKSTAKYSNTLVKATISGMILDVPVKVGNSVIQANTFNDGTTIATIANMNDLIFVGKVDETEVDRIKVGNHVTLVIGAMQDKSFDALLEYIAPKGTMESGATLFQVKAAVHKIDDDNFIRSGYSANGEIVTEKAENVLAVPEFTLEFAADSAFVYVENPHKEDKEKYTKTPVKIGLSDGFYVEIKEGITTDTPLRGKVVDDKVTK
ncbi:MAG: efflux RND transporter periplasmic adaptor subunit [Bacteroidetes bacterium]|nr:efflux RND transporter periplasmic adaptor subunit [Bacteroidota bacterium]MCL2303627.1 efflux RND transporter periplasmic adaptor subunit [Lentimicrobiaceae bacterium]